MVNVLALSLCNNISHRTALGKLINCEECEVVAISDPTADWDMVVFLVDQDTVPDAYVSIIETAINIGKPIIGVWTEVGPWPPIPIIFEKYASAMLPWNAERICDAICREELIWTEPEGTERPEGEFKRNRCRKPRAKHATS